MDLHVTISQKINITATLAHSLEILSMSSEELDSYLKEECEKNVLFDLEPRAMTAQPNDRYMYTQAPAATEGDYGFENYMSEEETFEDYLLEQVRFMELDSETHKIVTYLIYSLNKRGYLETDMGELAKSIGVAVEAVEAAHRILLSLEPRGVGARNLKECLLLQCEDKPLLQRLIQDHLEDIAASSFSLIMETLHITRETLGALIMELKHLHPIPSKGFADTRTQKVQYVVPDLVMEIEDGTISLMADPNNDIRINENYLHMMRENIDDETKQYLKRKLQRVMDIMNAVNRRQVTLKSICEYIVNYQKDYFLQHQALKPLLMKDISDALDISISTVSRALKGKYIQTPGKIMSIKELLSRPIRDNENSVAFIKERIRRIIRGESKTEPLSDEQIVDVLQRQGMTIKRRTVQKYRQEMGIQASRYRRAQ